MNLLKINGNQTICLKSEIGQFRKVSLISFVCVKTLMHQYLSFRYFCGGHSCKWDMCLATTSSYLCRQAIPQKKGPTCQQWGVTELKDCKAPLRPLPSVTDPLPIRWVKGGTSEIVCGHAHKQYLNSAHRTTRNRIETYQVSCKTIDIYLW